MSARLRRLYDRRPIEAVAPILFRPILKSRAWGGAALLALGRAPPTSAKGPFGESWELADLPLPVIDGRSVIDGGPFDGRTLHEAIAASTAPIMGRAALTDEGDFPLLVKILDAHDNLSVQVHPTRDYARRHPEVRAKSEAWIILRAAPDATIVRGVDPSLSRERFADIVRRGDDLLPHLVRAPVREGDCVPLPSGVCHALGAGIVAAEIQVPSDTTFRLWDWGRGDPSRPLHRDEALECVLLGADQELDDPPIVNAAVAPALLARGLRTVDLCRTDDFRIEQIETVVDHPVELEVVTDDMPVVWHLLSGRADFWHPEDPADGIVSAVAPRAVLLAASSAGWRAALAPGSRFLRVTLPDRMGRMLASDQHA